MVDIFRLDLRTRLIDGLRLNLVDCVDPEPVPISRVPFLDEYGVAFFNPDNRIADDDRVYPDLDRIDGVGFFDGHAVYGLFLVGAATEEGENREEKNYREMFHDALFFWGAGTSHDEPALS